MKVHAQPLSGRLDLGKRKLDTAISTIQEKVARTLNVTPEEINLDTSTILNRITISNTVTKWYASILQGKYSEY